MESFAELLRRHRRARSLTQAELAERARLTGKAVGALERGERRRPYPHTVRSLADALELEPEERARLVEATSTRPLGGDGRLAPQPVAPSSLLVAPVGPVIGRDDEVDALVAVLQRPRRRVVTLTGPGGVGKTTLALAVADRVHDDFPGGIVVVELAEVADPDDVLPALAAALGVIVADQRVTPALLAPVLTGRPKLILLDNLERVRGVAPALTQLVTLCPDLVLLATSRAPLRVRAEHEVRVAPLPHSASVLLFHDRAAASGLTLGSDPGTTAAVSAVCARADGLPLAVELAAAATTVLGPTALLTRLDALPAAVPHDLPDRQRSMQATLAWSHELLTAPARSLLARLSVCVGGFSLAAAEEIFAGEHGDAVVALIELLEHSMITRVADVESVERFRLLGPIREDAAARLDPVEREQALTGLARAMLDVAEALADDLHGPGQPEALRLLHADKGNLQEAYDHLIRLGGHDDAARLLHAVWMYFIARARAREGAAWASRLEGLPMSDASRLRCLIASAALAVSVGDLVGARRTAEEALALAETSAEADRNRAAYAAALAAFSAMFTGDRSGAEHLVERARMHGAMTGPPWVRLRFLVATSLLALNEGDLDTADEQRREGKSLEDRLDPYGRAVLSWIHSSLAERRGDHVEAAALVAEAVLLFLTVESSHMVAVAVPRLATAATRLEDLEAGAQLFGAASRYIAELDAAYQRQSVPSRDDLALVRAGLGEFAFASAWAAGQEATPDDLAALAHRFTGDSPDRAGRRMLRCVRASPPRP